MASTIELTDELRSAVAALLEVRPDEVVDITPAAWHVRVAEVVPGENGRTVNHRTHTIQVSG